MSGFAGVLLERLASASIAITLMVAVAWLVCRLRPSLPPATRGTIWWLVAAAALLRLAPLPALTIEVPGAASLGLLRPADAAHVPAPAPIEPAAPAASPTPAAITPAASRPFVPIAAAADPTAARTASLPGWRASVVFVWAAVALGLLVRLGLATRRLGRQAADAEPAPPEIAAEADRIATACGLSRTPPVRVSDDIETPQVLGLLRPTVLLPAGMLATMTARERAMTLCHELAHVRRRDLALAWAPAVMERLLFFHPAARLAAREYAFAREAACDAEVLQHLGEAPRDYGRLLLRLGVTRRPAALAAAQSSPSTRLLRRRLAMLNDHPSSPRPGRGIWLAGAAVVLLATPLSLVARQDEIPPPPPPPPAAPAVPAAIPPDPVAPPAPPAPPAAGVAGGVRGGESGGASGVDGGLPRAYGNRAGQAPPPPPPPPPARTMPPPPPPPPPPPADGAYLVGVGSRDTWVLLDGNGTHVFSGSWSDAEEAKRLRGSDGGPFLYYRTDGRTYVTRDRAVIDRVKAEMKEQRDLGEQQAALGAQQAGLGIEQAGLGAEQGKLGALQHELAAAMAARGMAQGQIGALEGALAALETQAARGDTELAAARKALREAIESLKRSQAGTAVKGHEAAAAAKADRMREVSEKQRELGRLQADLGAKQAALGKRQAELGQKQRLAAEAARRRILTILEEARAKGQIETVK